jgi:hypothetical protein
MESQALELMTGMSEPMLETGMAWASSTSPPGPGRCRVAGALPLSLKGLYVFETI